MSSDEGRITSWLHFASDHPTAEGHFPEHPVIPGAVLLDHIVTAIAASDAAVSEVRAIKFLRVVRPGDRLQLAWRWTGARDVAFEALGADNEPSVSGTLVADRRS